MPFGIFSINLTKITSEQFLLQQHVAMLQ